MVRKNLLEKKHKQTKQTNKLTQTTRIWPRREDNTVAWSIGGSYLSGSIRLVTTYDPGKNGNGRRRQSESKESVSPGVVMYM